MPAPRCALGFAALALTIGAAAPAAAYPTDHAYNLVTAAHIATNAPSSAPAWWQPKGKLSWQIHYAGTPNTGLNVQVYNLDGADTAASTVAALKRRGVKVICYFNGGATEDWRDDLHRFPASIKGKAMDGWDGEHWLDIRRLDILLPIMTDRMRVCKNKGFDGVDPDNMDVHTQDSGFTIKPAHQVAYHKALATAAHSMGLAIGIKNDVEQLRELEPYMDYAVNESCEEWDECDTYEPFIRSNKPVFHISYQKSKASSICRSKPRHFSTLIKNDDLDGWRYAC